MTCVGRIQANLVSANSDVTAGLLNINFDFAVVKLAAPAEFHELGQSLSLLGLAESRPRREKLLRCYGLRASEIASKCKQVHTSDHGFFHGQAGVGASSIWTAATSGEAAIRVHLLACMLARIWNGPEAISIWVEIIEGRKLLGLGYGFEAAALRQRDPYVEALEGVELLLSGSPQKMQSGELLLGLSAWHLYPDLNVLDVATAIVRQQDRLVPAYGILTIGFKRGDDYDLTRGRYAKTPGAVLDTFDGCILIPQARQVAEVRTVNDDDGRNNGYSYDTRSMDIDSEFEDAEQTLINAPKDTADQFWGSVTMLPTSRKSYYENLGETVKAVSDEPITTVFENETRYYEKSGNMRLVIGPIDNTAGLSNYEPWYGEISYFEYWFGDKDSVDSAQCTPLSALFKGKDMDTTRLLRVFEEALSSLGSSYIKSLHALATIDDLYKTKKSYSPVFRQQNGSILGSRILHSINTM
ncbi:hypothetical protein GMDG_02397 [Pseudogymnoascus destructans 20631-21]|uniref:Uncharacterized protein n=1 Tax=Pseudogymnoascus destructans (strain ATCC MYA-4855 / 20631-21) TaxID=658429 RepID=L8G3A7_PSED2|nr:hypothetical protein GMDG_02397 [Pseudogymnoascus destructans 20631-21]